MLQVTDFHANLANKPILEGISFAVNAGDVLQQLPTREFAVEAQKLLGISLEGSVG